uniref:Hedgehog/Intein (Hint) domain-containing protein n=1 Tax=viral metagenome TaxID=1070528 RepID=A0A6C0DJ44_9ZZZZ
MVYTDLTWANPTSEPVTQGTWTSVCYGNGYAVAVSEDNKAMYSSNQGVTWTNSTTLPASGTWQSVCYGNGYFVAVSGGPAPGAVYSAMYSTDNGNTWTISPSYNDISGAQWQSVCFGNGYFVAVSGSTSALNYSMYSSDGIIWTIFGTSIPNNKSWQSVCYGNGYFVAIDNQSNIAYSNDHGNTWTLQNNNTTYSSTWISICYGGNKFVAITRSQILGPPPALPSPSYVMYANQNTLTNWNYVDISNNSNGWRSICYGGLTGNEIFLAFGRANPTSPSPSTSLSSLDGISWVSTTNDPTLTTDWRSVCYATSNKFIGVANGPPPVTIRETIGTQLCFKEDTKILTDKGYVLIQNLKKGDLVQTLSDGLKPIDIICKIEMYHIASEERIKDQLYIYTSEEYPELLEELILTGGHSILVDNLDETLKTQINNIIIEDEQMIDNKYRLLAYIDEKSKVYENKGNHIIYHFALEGDYYKNYGVYANGLLLEACSQFYLKGEKNMIVVE